MPLGWLFKKGRRGATDTTDPADPRPVAAETAVAELPVPPADPVATPAPPVLPHAAPAPAGRIDIPWEKISQRALEKWVEKGRPAGADEQNWLEAEAELQAEYAARPAAEAKPNRPR